MSKRSRRYNTPDFNFIPEDICSYKSCSTLQSCCSADEILDRVKCDSNLIFKSIREGNPDILSVLPVDDNCMCDIGRGKRPYVNKQYCIGCEMLRRINSDVKLNGNKTIRIEVGKHIGKVLYVNEYEVKYGTYEENEELTAVLKKLTEYENQLYLLDDNFYDIYQRTRILSTTSSVTNYIATCVFINNKLLKYKIPNHTPYEWSYACKNKVYIIEPKTMSFLDVSNIESFQKSIRSPIAKTKVNALNEDIVFGILRQLTTSLHFLSKYSFIHGCPSIDFIRFSMKSCNYKYGNVVVTCPVTLHIKPSFLASIAYEDDSGKHTRLVFSNIQPGQELLNEYPIETTDIIINYKKRNVGDNQNIPMMDNLTEYFSYSYKIGNRLFNFTNFTNNYGIPLLHSSFEFYCFLLSLLCEDSFYETFMLNNDLRSAWYSLWRASEYEEMMEDLMKLKSNDHLDNEQLSKFLTNYTLRSDALKHFWDCVSTI